VLVVGLQRFAGCYCGSNPTWGMSSVSCECCVLSVRGLCVGPITLPEESYRVWCVCLSVMSKRGLSGMPGQLGGGEGEGCSVAMQNKNKIIFVVAVSVSAFCRTF